MIIHVGPVDSRFYTADTGPGTPESGHGAVFEPRHPTNGDGTDFDLRIVEEVTDAHGWEVAMAESRLGGARFETTGTEHIG